MKTFFTVRVLKHRNRLPSRVVDTPSLETFKAWLDVVVSNLIQWNVSLLMAGELFWVISEGPFQPKWFYDSTILG